MFNNRRLKNRKRPEIIKLTAEQSSVRKRKRSMDIWPDVGRYNVEDAFNTVCSCNDPLILSLFCDHRSARIRKMAGDKLYKIRMNAGLERLKENNYELYNRQ